MSRKVFVAGTNTKEVKFDDFDLVNAVCAETGEAFFRQPCHAFLRRNVFPLGLVNLLKPGVLEDFHHYYDWVLNRSPVAHLFELVTVEVPNTYEKHFDAVHVKPCKDYNVFGAANIMLRYTWEFPYLVRCFEDFSREKGIHENVAMVLAHLFAKGGNLIIDNGHKFLYPDLMKDHHVRAWVNGDIPGATPIKKCKRIPTSLKFSSGFADNYGGRSSLLDFARGSSDGRYRDPWGFFTNIKTEKKDCFTETLAYLNSFIQEHNTQEKTNHAA